MGSIFPVPNWSVFEKLSRYEVQPGIPVANTKNLMVIRNTFEEAGIEFIGDPLINPGVTLRNKRDD